MRHNPYEIVRMFEETVADYTGAPYAVSTDNCTDALLICCEYLKVEEVTIPAKTYLSVPQSIMHAGGTVKFRDYLWNGIYQLEPYPIWDAAKRLTSGMYIPGSFMCLSFHIKKHLKIGKGGMILTDNKEARDELKKLSYDGREPNIPWQEQNIKSMGYHYYMTPETAQLGLDKFEQAKHTEPREWNIWDWPDLTQLEIFDDK